MERAQLNAHEVKLTMSNAALRNDGFGELAHLANRAFEHDGLDALLMIEVRVHRGNRQVMMVVLKACQALGKLPLVMVVYVREIRNAGTFRVPLFAAVLQVGA
jgi:hypothetical protein